MAIARNYRLPVSEDERKLQKKVSAAATGRLGSDYRHIVDDTAFDTSSLRSYRAILGRQRTRRPMYMLKTDHQTWPMRYAMTPRA